MDVMLKVLITLDELLAFDFSVHLGTERSACSPIIDLIIHSYKGVKELVNGSDQCCLVLRVSAIEGNAGILLWAADGRSEMTKISGNDCLVLVTDI